MNIQAILLANIVGFLLIAFLFISRFITRTKTSAEEHIFNTMMWLVMIACIVESLTFIVDGKPGKINYWINLLGNTYLYFANGLGSFLIMIYVDKSLYHDNERIRKYYNKFGYFVAVLLGILFLNIPFGYYFYVDANNVYHRQPLINIFYFYMIVCAFFSFCIVRRFRRLHGRTAFFPILMYLGPILTGSILQMLFYGISLAWLGTAIGIVALYMSLQNQKVYQDSLTGLFNRMYLEHVIFSMNKDSGGSYHGIMIDMNYFKEINDTYGHSAGDRALIKAAEIFKRCGGIDSYVFRYAGDEFIIITKTDNEKDVINIERKIRGECRIFNERKDEPFELSVSMGHSKYDRLTDTEDTFLKRIDDAMYVDKERIHSGDKAGVDNDKED